MLESVCTIISFHLWLLGDHIKYSVSCVNRDCIIPESLSVHHNLGGKERAWKTQGLSAYIACQQIVVCEATTWICQMRSIVPVCVFLQIFFIYSGPGKSLM
jgi:hypothetical protein